MIVHKKWTARFVALAALLLLLVLAPVAEARIVRRSNQPPANPQPAAAAPASAACAPVVCCPRDICYRHHKGCGCYDPCKKMELILQVKDPCSCCLVEVPVCIPACCMTNPHVCCHKGFLGRQVVEYSWDCGFRLTVVFDRRGDITVHYYGA
jgi:hypothetical protein